MNLFAIPGASVAIVAFFYLAAIVVGRCRRQVNYLVWAAAIPMFAIGMSTSVWVQYDNGVAWTEQKQIWSEMLSTCPDVIDDSHVYLLLTGFDDRFQFATWQRAPLIASWEVTSALRVLYGNHTLTGAVIVPNPPLWLPQPEFLSDHIVDSELGALPYQRVLFFGFDRRQPNLRLVSNITQELSIPVNPDFYSEKRCIRDDQQHVPPTSLKFMDLAGIGTAQK